MDVCYICISHHAFKLECNNVCYRATIERLSDLRAAGFLNVPAHINNILSICDLNLLIAYCEADNGMMKQVSVDPLIPVNADVHCVCDMQLCTLCL